MQFVFSTFFLIFLHLCTFLIAPKIIVDLDADRNALLNFAASVPHTRNLNWNASASICSAWVGITCNANKTRVVGVRLPAIGLSGPIPPNTIGKLEALKTLSLRSNYLNGILPSDVTSNPSLQYLYLQHNNFSGTFPALLSPQLNVLDLSFNSFTGNIPIAIQNLTKLKALYLQHNSFSGEIPNIHPQILKVLNCSFNELSGTIPRSLQKFPYDSFVGNTLLCGFPSKQLCSSTTSPPPSPSPSQVEPEAHATSTTDSDKKLSTNVILAIVIGVSAVFFLVMVAFIVFCRKGKENRGKEGKSENETSKDFGSGVQGAEKNKLFFFEGCSNSFDLEDLLRGSAEVLGKGSYGTAYKAVLEDGTIVVVKRLREIVVGKKEFEQQMDVVGRVSQHPNIVLPIAYYCSKDEKLLVYNYMDNGSFSSLLHGNTPAPLTWDARMKICLGAARGVAHIHSEGGAKCIHGNIKASNVFLTPELDGCISDFGLAPLMNFPRMPRTMGYCAPEVFETHKITQKSDVYSYGVLLLEMLTGKSPVQGDVVDLPRWVRSVVREEWTAEVFDVELTKHENIQEDIVQVLQLALSCVAKKVNMRPEMNEVVRMMEEIIQPPSLSNSHSFDAEGSDVHNP